MSWLRTLSARARRSGLLSLALMILVMLAFRSAVADWHDVPSGSMQPTLLVGDRIVVDKLAYDVKLPFGGGVLHRRADPAAGDIVTCRSPADGKRLVKRVIGLPGDVIEMRDNRLTVNGRRVAYGPVDETALRSLVGAEAAGWRFAREELRGRPHAVAFAGGGRRPDVPAFRVPDGQYFLLGDNRDLSADSRWFGFVARDDIAGRVIGLAGSLDIARGFRPRWERFCSRVS
ncbi:signal peptidase I [bacterium]|nr:signal peptidase I [bacterium]